MNNLVQHNLLDIEQYQSTLTSSNMLKNLIRQTQALIPEIDQLSLDLFLLLYKIILRFNDHLPTNERFILILAISSHPRMDLLRRRTAGSRWESYLAMKILLDLLVEKLRGRPILKELKEITSNMYPKSFKASGETTPKMHEAYTSSENKLIQEIMEKTRQGIHSEYLEIFTLELKRLLEKANTDKTTSDETRDLSQLAQLHTSPNDDTSSSPMESFIEKVHETGQEEESTDSLSDLLDQVIQKEGALDETYESRLKEDFEQRFSPYLKSLLLSEGDSNDQNVINRSIDAIEDSAHTEANKITDGKPKPDKSPVDISFKRKTSEKERMELLKDPKISKQLGALNLDQVIQSTTSKLDDFEMNIQTLGIPSESLNDLTFDDVIDLYTRTKNPKFIDFINKVGRHKDMASKIAHKKKRARITPIDGIRHSNDLDSLIEDELIQFALDIDAFENDFYDRYLRSDLLTLEMAANKHKRKGPIILCYDGSGSMQGVKFEETVMHILSIMEIAKIQKRRMVVIQFASASEPMYIKIINPLSITAQDVMDLLDTFICGGTNFEKPLSHAMTIIKEAKHKNSDILFITDGQCEISKTFKEAFMALKKEKRFKLYTIIMHSYTYQDYGDIGDISDEILDIRGDFLGNWSDKVNERIYNMI